MASVLPRSGVKVDYNNPRGMGISMGTSFSHSPPRRFGFGFGLGLGLGLGIPTSFTIGEFSVYVFKIGMHVPRLRCIRYSCGHAI